MPGPLSRRRTQRKLDGPPDPAFAYRVGWLKEARTWDAHRRSAVAEGLRLTLSDPSFSPNEFRRLHRVPGLDESLHAGASLLALQQVLQALETDR